MVESRKSQVLRVLVFRNKHTLPGFEMLDLAQLLRHIPGENLASVFGYQNRVLDANPDPFLDNINPWFYGDDHARFQRTHVANIVR